MFTPALSVRLSFLLYLDTSVENFKLTSCLPFICFFIGLKAIIEHLLYARYSYSDESFETFNFYEQAKEQNEKEFNCSLWLGTQVWNCHLFSFPATVALSCFLGAGALIPQNVFVLVLVKTFSPGQRKKLRTGIVLVAHAELENHE